MLFDFGSGGSGFNS